MEASLKVTDNLTIKVEGKKDKALFKELSKVQEVFGHSKCGCCGSSDVSFVVRNVDDNDFYELRCNNNQCRAKLVFGQHKSGDTIFPKRHWGSLSDKEKEQRGPEPPKGYLADNGWFKWVAK